MANEDTGAFNTTAVTLSRNPLGLIALFIVLVYAMAALVITVPGSKLTSDNITTIVWFLVLFPVLVLGLFGYLVIKHARNLYSPSDFADQKDWVELQKQAIAQLTAASVANAVDEPTADIIEGSAKAVAKASSLVRSKRVGNGILWVDDNPDKLAGLRRTFEAFNIPVVTATGDAGALSLAAQRPFDAIITDTEHDGKAGAGYALAEKLRTDLKITAPIIVFTSAAHAKTSSPKRKFVTSVTNNASDLFQQVTQAVRG